MRAEFSEFTYGFSVVQELTTALGCTAVPVFPSLVKEGQVGGGYDVQMDVGAVPFYIQFKLSEHLKTNNAKEAKVSNSPLLAPYRRFPITSSITSKQHEMLVALNAQHEHVYYCAPDYVTNETLNTLWQAGASSERSVYVKPSDIGPITDGEKHAVCFDRQSITSDTCYLFSKPQKLQTHPLVSLRSAIQRSLSDAEIPLRDLLPKWMIGLDDAREKAVALHGPRVEAIHKLLAERRAARAKAEGFDPMFDANMRIQERVGFDMRSGELVEDIERGALGLGRGVDLQPRASDPDEDMLSAFARQVASEFGVQTFILQRTE